MRPSGSPRTVSAVPEIVSGSSGGTARTLQRPAPSAAIPGAELRGVRRIAHGDHGVGRCGSPIARWRWHDGVMALPQVAPIETPEIKEVPDDDRPWVTIVWDDPVNLM